jgi:hypothetical protein
MGKSRMLNVGSKVSSQPIKFLDYTFNEPYYNRVPSFKLIKTMIQENGGYECVTPSGEKKFWIP